MSAWPAVASSGAACERAEYAKGLRPQNRKPQMNSTSPPRSEPMTTFFMFYLPPAGRCCWRGRGIMRLKVPGLRYLRYWPPSNNANNATPAPLIRRQHRAGLGRDHRAARAGELHRHGMQLEAGVALDREVQVRSGREARIARIRD